MTGIIHGWCLITFCGGKGPRRGNPDNGLFICDRHWELLHEVEQQKLEAITAILNQYIMDCQKVDKIRKILEAEAYDYP